MISGEGLMPSNRNAGEFFHTWMTEDGHIIRIGDLIVMTDPPLWGVGCIFMGGANINKCGGWWVWDLSEQKLICPHSMYLDRCVVLSAFEDCVE